jgi:hypothetical protein
VAETENILAHDILAHGRRIAELERKVRELYKRLGQARRSRRSSSTAS